MTDYPALALTAASDDRAFLEAVCEHLTGAGARRDLRANVLTVAGQLAACADWSTSTSRPTWAAMIERTGMPHRTVARCVRRLRDAHLIAPRRSVREHHARMQRAPAGNLRAARAGDEFCRTRSPGLTPRAVFGECFSRGCS